MQMRNGKIMRVRVLLDRQEALEAVGLSEQPAAHTASSLIRSAWKPSDGSSRLEGGQRPEE